MKIKREGERELLHVDLLGFATILGLYYFLRLYLSCNEIQDIFAGFFTGNLGSRRRSPAEDDYGGEEQGRGEQQRPKVGEDLEEAWSKVEEREDDERESEGN